DALGSRKRRLTYRETRSVMSESEQDYRLEHDSMGDVRVPASAKWRAQTQRAVENVPVAGQRISRSHIGALARIKAAAAAVNGKLGVLDPDVAEAIVDA